MQYITLGQSDLKVSRACFGCGPLGVHGYGDVDLSAANAAARSALENGINFFDTSDTYGLGCSEEQLGNLLQGNKNVVIGSKFGVRIDSQGKSYFDNSAAWCRAALEASLKRLKREWIDLYSIHYWDKITPLEEVFSTLEALRTAGKFKYAGISNFPITSVLNFKLPAWVVCTQLEFSLLNLNHQAALAEADRFSLTPMPYGCLAQGMLSGKYSERSDFAANDRRSRPNYINFHGDKLKSNIKVLEQLKVLANDSQRSLVSLSLGWVLATLPLSSAIVAAKNVLQLKEILDAYSRPLEKELVQKVNQIVGK